jgi:inner membrane protein involved in colicin E2 resistance
MPRAVRSVMSRLAVCCVLFAALAGTMYFTRKIDWYRVADQIGAEPGGS